MDIDISNILYIVITLVAVLVGVLGKKKKPASATGSNTGSQSRPGFFENLEKVLAMGQEEPRVVDLEAYEEDLPAEEEVPDPAPEDSQLGFNMREGGIMENYERIMNSSRDEEDAIYMSEGREMTDQLEVIDLDLVTEQENFDFVKNFDARTAIVYSAIIDRLDY